MKAELNADQSDAYSKLQYCITNVSLCFQAWPQGRPGPSCFQKVGCSNMSCFFQSISVDYKNGSRGWHPPWPLVGTPSSYDQQYSGVRLPGLRRCEQFFQIYFLCNCFHLVLSYDDLQQSGVRLRGLHRIDQEYNMHISMMGTPTPLRTIGVLIWDEWQRFRSFV